MATVKFLGSSDEVTTCDHCGRAELKYTIALEIDDEEVVHFGSTCASYALAGRGIKIAAGTIKRKSQDADAARRRAELEAEHAAESARWFAWLHAATGQTDVFRGIEALGGYTAAMTRYRAGR